MSSPPHAPEESWLDRLERRLGRFAPGNLTYWLVGAMCAAFVVGLVHPPALAWIRLDPALVMKGQVWRLVTFLVEPATMSPISALFSFYWLHYIGRRLEVEWGPAKYATFWATGALATLAVSLGLGVPADNSALLLGLFLAFATLHPNEEVLIFFFLPVAVKWLALVDLALLLFLVGWLPGFQKLVPVAGLASYLVFFAPALWGYARGYVHRASRAGTRARFVADAAPPPPRVRRCTVCGLTSEDPDAEFRVCVCDKCKTPTEFCLAHARDH